MPVDQPTQMMHIAACRDDVEYIREHKTIAMTLDEYWLSPLWYACYYGNKNAARVLVEECSCRIDSFGYSDAVDRYTIVYGLVVHNRIAGLMIALDLGATLSAYSLRLNGREQRWRHPLSIAIRENFTDIAKLLIDNEYSTFREDDTGRSPLTLIVERNNVDLLSHLINASRSISYLMEDKSYLHTEYGTAHPSATIVDYANAHGCVDVARILQPIQDRYTKEMEIIEWCSATPAH